MMDCAIEGEYEFSGIGHILSIKAAGNKLDIEVTNGLTNEVWQATFDASFIESMTKKTGNFKQFPVFVNMLRSAVLKTTDSVWLDLLSYADLEKLRAKKSGAETNSHGTASNNSAHFNKRYLILMYNVEFDRIHFPLPLTPVSVAASSDAAHVHAVVVRELQNEIRILRNQLNSDYRVVGYDEMKRNYERAVEERRALEDAYRQIQEECQILTHDGSVKQVRMLKNVIRQLEQDIMEAKSQHQHTIAKRDKDIKALVAEVEDLRSNERVLKTRIRNLTQELQNIKKFSGNRSSYHSLTDYESKLTSGRLGLVRPPVRQPVQQRPKVQNVTNRDYGRSYLSESKINRGRSTSRESTTRQRSASRSPSRIPVRLPTSRNNDLRLSARSTRSTKSAVERPLPPMRFSSRSPSPAARLPAPRLSNSSTKIQSRVRTPSVSSIASNNSDLSIAFGNTSLNNSQRQVFLRRAPVAKAVVPARHVARREIPTLRQQQQQQHAIESRKKQAMMMESAEENYFDKSSFVDDITSMVMKKSVERPLVDSQMHNRAAEMLEIDARLKRLHNLLKDSDLSV